MTIADWKIFFNSGSLSNMIRFKCFLLTGFASLSAILMTGCFESKAQNDRKIDRQTTEIAQTLEEEKLKIVTTFLPIHLFTQAVAGDRGQIDILISPGAEIHDYQATPEDAKILAQANILIKNGLGLEEFLEGLIVNVGNTQLKQINASENIEVIDVEEEQHEHEHEHEHHHADGDPHVWLDPVLAQQQIINIRDGLIAVDPDNADTYLSNADAYLQQLQQLDREFSQRLASVEGCKFVTFHDAFVYLAQRYGLQQEAVVEIPEDSITPRDIQRIEQTVEEFQVKALLTEAGIKDKRIEQIADDLNLPLEEIDPLETGNTNPQYYFQVMKNNLDALERACK